MLNLFEEYTSELSDEEKKLLPVFVSNFINHVGEENCVTASEMVSQLNTRFNYIPKLNGSRVRKILHHIRVEGLVKNLIASKYGYYIENDPLKLKEYVITLRQRAASIKQVADSYQI